MITPEMIKFSYIHVYIYIYIYIYIRTYIHTYMYIHTPHELTPDLV